MSSVYIFKTLCSVYHWSVYPKAKYFNTYVPNYPITSHHWTKMIRPLISWKLKSVVRRNVIAAVIISTNLGIAFLCVFIVRDYLKDETTKKRTKICENEQKTKRKKKVSYTGGWIILLWILAFFFNNIL